MIVDAILLMFAAILLTALVSCVRRPPPREAPFFDDRFFNRSPDPLCVIGRDGRFRRVSRSFAETLGYGASALLDSLMTDFVHPDDRDSAVSELGEVTTDGAGISSFEARFSCEDGSVRHLCWRFFPYPDGIYGIAQDKTDQTLREEHLRELNDDLEQLLYIASHDLREPLVGAAGFISLVISKYQDSMQSEASDFLKEALDGIRLMEKKIDDLLLLSRAGRIGTDEHFHILDAVQDAMASLNGRLSDVGMYLDMDRACDQVVGSRVMIGQVIQNIIGNALKYRSSDRSLRISMRAVRDGRFLKVSIADNGIGFDPHHAERIFQAFQRLHSSDSPYSGTGIGLALCRKIVTRHGGSIWAESVEGKGSTFHFTLPARKDGEDEHPAD